MDPIDAIVMQFWEKLIVTMLPVCNDNKKMIQTADEFAVAYKERLNDRLMQDMPKVIHKSTN